MKRGYTGSLFAVAFAVCGSAAYAQNACQDEIQELQSELAASQDVDAQDRQRIMQMLTSAGQGPEQNCQLIVADARAQLTAAEARGAQQPAGPAGAAGGAGAAAQAQQDRAQGAVEADRERSGAALAEREQRDESSARTLVGNNVMSRDGEEVGEISGIARSRSTNEEYALVDVGGFLGLGERTVPIPIDQAQINSDGDLVTTMTREELENLTEYDADQFTVESD